MNKPPTTESTTGTRIYKIAQRLTGLGIAIVPTYPGEHGAKFSAWQNQATTFMSTVDQWMNQGYPLANGPHIVTPDHNWVCVAKRTGVGCLDIDNYEKCLAVGMPPLPEDVFKVNTPGGGLHVPFVHTADTAALNNTHVVWDGEGDDRKPIFEFKGHNSPWCAPGQQRSKDGGWYKARNSNAPLQVGLPADLISWLVKYSEAPSPNHTPVPWDFDEDLDLDGFATHHEAALDGRDYYDGVTLYAPVEECPACGHSAGGSTARHASCKFIFGGRGRGGYKCHACGISSLEELETALQEKDPDWQPWDGPVYKRADTSVAPEWTSPEELELAAAHLPDEEARKAVRSAWKQAAAELFEIRKGLEFVLDEKTGKTKTRQKFRHQIDDEVLASSYNTLKNVMAGKFFVDAYPYIFLPLEKRVYKFHDDEAVYRLLSRFGLRRTQHDYKLVDENLHHEILMNGKSTHIEKFGCMRGDAIYVNDGRNGIIKITADEFLEVPNGTDEVYMLNKHLTPWPALDAVRMSEISDRLGRYGGKVTAGSKLCQHLNAFFDDGQLTPEQYHQLVILRYLSLFVGTAIDLRPILLALGVQNSGKSTLWEKFMWLFYGTKYESAGLPTNLRSFVAAITNHQIQLFDNIDRAGFDNTKSDYSQYMDLMCKCSTGGKIQIAQLYENNVEKDYDLRCDLFLTARTQPFPSHASDLLRRTLIFPIRKPEKYKRTEIMKRDLVADADEIKLETLVRLQLILKAQIANRDKEYDPVSEMHSYESFTMRIADYEGWPAEMKAIWEGYYEEYRQRAAEDSPFVNIIRCWLGREGNVGRWVRTGEIYRNLEEMYSRPFTQTWRSDASFGKKLKENYSALGLLGIEKKFLQGGTTYRFTPQPEQWIICKDAYKDSLTRYAREVFEQPDADVIG